MNSVLHTLRVLRLDVPDGPTWDLQPHIPYVLGKHPACRIHVSHRPTVSREHAILTFDGFHLTVREKRTPARGTFLAEVTDDEPVWQRVLNNHATVDHTMLLRCSNAIFKLVFPS